MTSFGGRSDWHPREERKRHSNERFRSRANPSLAGPASGCQGAVRYIATHYRGSLGRERIKAATAHTIEHKSEQVVSDSHRKVQSTLPRTYPDRRSYEYLARFKARGVGFRKPNLLLVHTKLGTLW